MERPCVRSCATGLESKYHHRQRKKNYEKRHTHEISHVSPKREGHHCKSLASLSTDELHGFDESLVGAVKDVKWKTPHIDTQPPRKYRDCRNAEPEN